jgi:dTDP-4-dehydrorhamnose reductase
MGIMLSVNNLLGQYSELGLSRLETDNSLPQTILFKADTERAISLLYKFNNAVFICGNNDENWIIVETLNKFCRDASGKILREAFQLDAKKFMKFSGSHTEVYLKKILGFLEAEREKILLVITSLEEFAKNERMVELIHDIVKKPSVPLLGMTTIEGFRQLERMPKVSGYLQFILSGKTPQGNKRDKSVLVIGATSLLGNAVYHLFSREYSKVRGTGFSKASSLGFDKLDVTSEEEIRNYFSKYPFFEIIIYIAGEADADVAERERDRARLLNIGAVSIIARHARDCKFVYISSEYVFDGSSGPYGSYSSAHPINYYGQTKLEGEKAALKSFHNALVVRFGALYGYNGPSDKNTSVSKLIASLDKPESLKADNIQIKHPILLEDAARTLLKLLDYETEGIYQTNGPEGLNKQEMAKRIADVRGELLGKKFSYPIVGIEQTGIAAKPIDTHMVNVDTPRLFEEGVRFLFMKQKTFKGELTHEH